MTFCDLHTHSTYSDGTCTPAQLIAEAEAMGLSAIALTDHNTVNGLADFNAAAAGSRVEIVNGCEFSTDLDGRELHIVGLFLPERYWEQVRETVRMRNALKEQSNIETVERLRAAGYDISYDAIRAANPNGTVNRVHLANALIGCGYIKTVNEGFKTLLNKDMGYYREPLRIPAVDVVRRIRDWGAAAVWAHPPLSNPLERIPHSLEVLKQAGLDAAETRYSTYTDEERAFMDGAVSALGFLPSGGSDYHGDNKPDIRLGTGRGDLQVPDSFYRDLRELAGQRGAV